MADGIDSPADLLRADWRMRHWRAAGDGPLAPGSDAHRAAFCQMLLDTHNPYRPAVIDWPQLEPEALARVTGLPIWDIAVQTEGRASVNVHAFAALEADPLLRAALTMDADEEARHKQVLARLVAAYGIRLAPEPDYPVPKHPEFQWLKTGYSECIDSFFAFGLFAAAQRSGYFPPELVETFEPVMQEEARHILFFVNWVAWRRRTLPLWRRPLFLAQRALVWLLIVAERIGMARTVDASGNVEDPNFAVAGSEQIGLSLSPRELLDLCLAENDRRMAGYDPRLLRPRLVPALVRSVRRWLLRG
jgi:hypothetical protein